MTLEKVQGSDWQRRIVDNFAVIGERGTHVVTAGEDSANSAAIATGKADATAFIVQIFRSGANVAHDAAVSISDGTLTVADGSTYALTTADVINWIVF